MAYEATSLRLTKQRYNSSGNTVTFSFAWTRGSDPGGNPLGAQWIDIDVSPSFDSPYVSRNQLGTTANSFNSSGHAPNDGTLYWRINTFWDFGIWGSDWFPSRTESFRVFSPASGVQVGFRDDPDGTYTALLGFTPTNMGSQYLDVTDDPNFGQFSSFQLNAGQSSAEINRLTLGHTYYARVTTLSPWNEWAIPQSAYTGAFSHGVVPPPPPPPSGGDYTWEQLAYAARMAGFCGSELVIAVAVFHAENQPHILDLLSYNGSSLGPAQINTSVFQDKTFDEVTGAGPLPAGSPGSLTITRACIVDLACSMRAAHIIYLRSNGFSPWDAYRVGSHLTWIPRAQQAVATVPGWECATGGATCSPATTVNVGAGTGRAVLWQGKPAYELTVSWTLPIDHNQFALYQVLFTGTSEQWNIDSPVYRDKAPGNTVTITIPLVMQEQQRQTGTVIRRVCQDGSRSDSVETSVFTIPALPIAASYLTRKSEFRQVDNSKVTSIFLWAIGGWPEFPSHKNAVFIDLSATPTFDPGTYQGFDVTAQELSAVVFPGDGLSIAGMEFGATRYLRINTRFDDVWMPSQILTIVVGDTLGAGGGTIPLPASNLRETSRLKLADGSYNIGLAWTKGHWDQGVPDAQWLDVATEPGFVSYIVNASLGINVEAAGLNLAPSTYYIRINTHWPGFTPDERGWFPSSTYELIIAAVPPAEGTPASNLRVTDGPRIDVNGKIQVSIAWAAGIGDITLVACDMSLYSDFRDILSAPFVPTVGTVEVDALPFAADVPVNISNLLIGGLPSAIIYMRINTLFSNTTWKPSTVLTIDARTATISATRKRIGESFKARVEFDYKGQTTTLTVEVAVFSVSPPGIWRIKSELVSVPQSNVFVHKVIDVVIGQPVSWDMPRILYGANVIVKDTAQNILNSREWDNVWEVVLI